MALAFRGLALGCRYVPEAVAHHCQSASAGSTSLRKLFWIERNRVWVMLKHLPALWILASPWHTLRRLWASYRAGRRGDGVAGRYAQKHPSLLLLACLCHAWVAALWRAPRMLRKRWRLQRQQRISAGDFLALLERFRASVDDMAFGASHGHTAIC